ncbi:hypothetical protein ACFVZH_39785 [Streptomyces sp. NPDC059534]|uniref:hypothetical protein n=1 Tax=Streptomyces sp. NPDC059534 TaxID=3346859 RepID=UPI0036983EF4
MIMVNDLFERYMSAADTYILHSKTCPACRTAVTCRSAARLFDRFSDLQAAHLAQLAQRTVTQRVKGA